MDAIPVTLIVKAPNQQFELKIECELDWTIKRLKGHLSEVYPCKPSTEEQKLIYSGQLLHDGVVLKDVLRQYEGQETHTVHLVYTPRMRQQQQQDNQRSKMATTTDQNNDPSISGSGDQSNSNPIPSQAASQNPSGPFTEGLRHRHVSSSPSATDGSTSAAASSSQTGSSSSSSVAASALPNYGASNLHSYYQQQAFAYQTWMQQQYVQYMNQCMGMMATGAGMNGMAPGMVQNPMFFNPQQQQQSLQMPSPGVVPSPGNAINGQNQVQNLPNGQQNDEARNREENRPRFPVLVHDNDGDNRDWLDDINALVRLALFLTMIYFYSSPIRCLIVVIVGIGLYCYYHRQRLRNILFRSNLNHLNNNNNQNRVNLNQLDRNLENADNNNNINDATNRNQVVVEGEENAALLEPGAEPPPTTNQEEQNSRTTVLAFIRTFVTSFFASLIPEPPAAT